MPTIGGGARAWNCQKGMRGMRDGGKNTTTKNPTEKRNRVREGKEVKEKGSGKRPSTKTRDRKSA